MSEELKRSGVIVGSAEYFYDCNRKASLEKWMPRSKPFAYDEGIKDIGAKTEKTLAVVYEDCRKYAQYLRHFPENERKRTEKMVEGLCDFAAFGGKGIGCKSSLMSLLQLNASETKTFSSASESEVRNASDAVVSGKYTSASTQMELLGKATEKDVLEVRDKLEAEFLENICTGKKKEVLKDILMRAQYLREKDRMYGKCGYVIFTDRYLEWVEKEIFGEALKSRVGDSFRYRWYFSAQLIQIRDEISNDLEQGLRNHDYITDRQRETLLLATKNLEKCGVDCYNLEKKIKSLAWFVGGDPRKIEELQRKLNALGFAEQLKVDGVYGPKTHAVWCEFLDTLVRGSVPMLAWLDPLQSKSTNIVLRDYGSGRQMLMDLSQNNGRGVNVFRADPPHPNRGVDYYHINVLDGAGKGEYPANKVQKWMYDQFNHKQISPKAQKILSNLGDNGKLIRYGGKALWVIGTAADVIDIGYAVYEDLNDSDKKLGPSTVMKGASIGGSWAGAAALGKLGAWAGANVGTVIFPGPGTAIGGVALGLIFGLIGAVGGEALAEWVVDVTILEE